MDSMGLEERVHLGGIDRDLRSTAASEAKDMSAQ